MPTTNPTTTKETTQKSIKKIIKKSSPYLNKDFAKNESSQKESNKNDFSKSDSSQKDFSKARESLIIYGKQILLFAIAHHTDKIEQIYLSKEVDKAMFAKLKSTHKPIIKIDNKKAQALARGGNHQGFLASIYPPNILSLKQIKAFDKILVLCGLNDMGNIGSIFRSGYALGVDGIILADSFLDINDSKNAAKNAQKLSTILRSSAGAALSMPFCIVPSALSIINELKEAGFAIYGSGTNGENIVSTQNLAHNKWALFLGGEASGLCGKITKKFDKILSIKMHRSFDSLNVSVAAGILISYLRHKMS